MKAVPEKFGSDITIFPLNPISYDKNGFPNLKGHHLVAYVATSEEVAEALKSMIDKSRFTFLALL